MIRVDGVTIPEDLISLEAQLQDAPDPAAAWEVAARGLVVRQLLLAEAERQGVTGIAPEEGEAPEEAAIRCLLETELKLPEPSEAELRRWYDKNRERLRAPDLWRAQHILIAANPRDEIACDAAWTTAERLLSQVEADPDCLPNLARQWSDCPSKSAGGDLGLIERGSTVPEFEAVLTELEPGQVCPSVVRSRYGMHVVRLLAREPGRVPPFLAVRERIAAFLREVSWRRAVQGYITMLAGRARIEGFDLFGGEGAPPRVEAWPAGNACVSSECSSAARR
ncbi:MAG: peptidyl-prolyl cis-trans isomerase [Acetobacteraceae bacterium]|nr:peptidyl-prolyl cis-trans isomerase [Acetobacteraceae bacterium]